MYTFVYYICNKKVKQLKPQENENNNHNQKNLVRSYERY